jgi:hypothetical protein
MAFSLTWLPQVLLNAGLKVAEQPGWRTRGRGDVGTIKGVICHHCISARAVGHVLPQLWRHSEARFRGDACGFEGW